MAGRRPMTRAIILAAGQGSRLRPLTDDIPKALTPLFGRPLVEHQLKTLRDAGIESIGIVGGYRADRLETLGIPVILNPDFETTNMVASLAQAADFLQADAADTDVVVAYGDIAYEPRNLAAVLGSSKGDIAVMIDTAWRDLWEARFDDPLSDAETLVMDGDRIVELGRKPEDYSRIEGQFTGLMRIAPGKFAELTAAYHALPAGERSGMYMTDFLQGLIDGGWDVRAAKVASGWLEVDTVEDHAIYHSMADEGRLAPLFDPAAIWG